ncbi:contractile injection system protein, VgrG/Pvc8 family [Aeromonas schubertii]|uniref:contractile injection system protein, VgrG/Pvc8 family n=1 Tax=Aeromonas schubertii TaxID=652 RepID=UPI0013652FF7
MQHHWRGTRHDHRPLTSDQPAAEWWVSLNLKSDLAFVNRLAAEEGLFYFHEFDEFWDTHHFDRGVVLCL